MDIVTQLSVLTEPAISGILIVPEWDCYVINLWMHKLELWKVCITYLFPNAGNTIGQLFLPSIKSAHINFYKYYTRKRYMHHKIKNI